MTLFFIQSGYELCIRHFRILVCWSPKHKYNMQGKRIGKDIVWSTDHKQMKIILHTWGIVYRKEKWCIDACAGKHIQQLKLKGCILTPCTCVLCVNRPCSMHTSYLLGKLVTIYVGYLQWISGSWQIVCAVLPYVKQATIADQYACIHRSIALTDTVVHIIQKLMKKIQ